MSQQVLAKFECSHVTNYVGQKQVHLSVVTRTSEENKTFAKYTPFGKIELTINPGTLAENFFEPGKEYRLTFEEVVKSE